MSRAITENQLADFWYAEFGKRGHCCLCGNAGIIDTRGEIFTPAGIECGDIVFCICPNGRAIKAQDPSFVEALRAPDAPAHITRWLPKKRNSR